jgi:uncharacterized membrane protein YphA (DoxX/SURF4 family)
MIDLDNARRQLHADLGYKPLHKTWARLEILVGLLAVGGGLLLILGPVLPRDAWLACAGLVLFVLGGYLTLAGHRSHLYQSMNDHTAYLLEQLRRLKPRVEES